MSKGQPHWKPILDVSNPQVVKWVIIQYNKHINTIWAGSLPMDSYENNKWEAIQNRPGYMSSMTYEYLSPKGIEAVNSGRAIIKMQPTLPPFPYQRKSRRENTEFWESWLYYYWLNQALGFYVYIGDYYENDNNKNVGGSIAFITRAKRITINRWFERIKRKISEIDITDY